MSDAGARAEARAAWAQARAAAAAVAGSGRLGKELTPVLALAILPQLDAAIADLDDGLPLDAIGALSASLPDAVESLAGPLGLAPALRPVQEDVARGLAALQPPK